MKHFDSFSSYLRFAVAKEFSRKDSGDLFCYTKNRCEVVGDLLSRPILGPLDFSIRNGRNPLFIIAMTVAALFVATLLFYPAVVSSVMTVTVTAVVKMVAFTLVQAAILGLGLKTCGRLNHRELMREWDQRQLVPHRLGTLKV